MEISELNEIQSLLPYFIKYKNIWSDYDSEADALYIHFKNLNNVDNSEMRDDDIIVHYEKNELVGVTILNASKRNGKLITIEKFLGTEVRFYSVSNQQILIESDSGTRLVIDANGKLTREAFNNDSIQNDFLTKEYINRAKKLIK